MPRLYLPAIQPEKNLISITGDKAHYLASVLRCQEGDELILFDGEGNCFRTTITKSDRREVIADVLEKFTCDLESPLDIILMQGLLKGEKMDMVVQKTVELGVAEIIPVITIRSQVRETKKTARWRKIAEEAARQSGRSVIPIVHAPVAFNDLFLSHDLRFTPCSIIFYEEGGISLRDAIKRMQDTGYTNSTLNPTLIRGEIKGGQASCILHPASRSISILIGPEGGFTREEVAFAEEKGLIMASLGKRVLRAETAAIASVALIQFLLGDMG